MFVKENFQHFQIAPCYFKKSMGSQAVDSVQELVINMDASIFATQGALPNV